MSFCYARIEENEIFIGADMKFSTDNLDMTKSYFGDIITDNMKKYGIIKNIIINDNICIAFAGNNILLADELLARIEWNGKDFKKIIKEASVIHQNAEDKNDIEFIIAYASCNDMKLIQIKNGMTKELDECWIGSEETYDAMVNMPIKDTELVVIDDGKMYVEQLHLIHKLLDRFEDALKTNKDNTVGKESINIRYCKEENRFKYNERYETNTGLKPQIIPPGEAVCFDVSARDGGYTTFLYADERNAVYKHFGQINKRVCYYKGYINDGRYCYLYLPRFEEEEKI